MAPSMAPAVPPAMNDLNGSTFYRRVSNTTKKYLGETVYSRTATVTIITLIHTFLSGILLPLYLFFKPILSKKELQKMN